MFSVTTRSLMPSLYQIVTGPVAYLHTSMRAEREFSMRRPSAALTTAAAIAPTLTVAPIDAHAATAAATPAPGPISAPPMGWNSWNRFGCNIDEGLIRSTADAMVSTGLRDAGYKYV